MDRNKQVLQSLTSAKKQQGAAALVFAIFIVIIAALIAAGIYFYKDNRQRMDLLYQYLGKVEAELDLKKQTISEFRKQLAKVSADSVTQDGIMNDHIKVLDENLTRVSKRVGKVEAKSSQNWLLAEVEYLLRMADHRILMKEDVKGAIAILKSADDLIKQMPTEDSGLRDVRIAIAKDIASLEIYNNVDVPGTYADLVALGETIEKLPLTPTGNEETKAKEDDKLSTHAEKEGFIEKVNRTMGDYLTIRRYTDEELKRLLSPEERRNLRDSLRLSLEQAETALLRGNQIVYDKSLNKVRNWLHNYFVASDYRVELAIAKLEKLSSVRVDNQLPDIAGSQQALKRYLADKMRRGEY